MFVNNVVTKALLLASGVLLSSAGFSALNECEDLGPTGEIKFIGKIIDTGCNISIYPSSTINLGIYTKDFFKNNKTTPAVPFQIEVSGCNFDDVKKYGLVFIGEPYDESHPELLKNTGRCKLGEELGVGVAMTYAPLNRQIEFGTANRFELPFDLTDAVSKQTFNFTGHMVRVADPDGVRAGEVESTVNMVLVYR